MEIELKGFAGTTNSKDYVPPRIREQGGKRTRNRRKKSYRKGGKSRKQKGGELDKDLKEYLKTNLTEIPTIRELNALLDTYGRGNFNAQGHEIIRFVISLFPPAMTLRPLPPSPEQLAAKARAQLAAEARLQATRDAVAQERERHRVISKQPRPPEDSHEWNRGYE